MNLIKNHLPRFSLLLHTAALKHGAFSLHLSAVAAGLLLSWVLSKCCPIAALQPRRQSGISCNAPSCLQACQKCLDPPPCIYWSSCIAELFPEHLSCQAGCPGCHSYLRFCSTGLKSFKTPKRRARLQVGCKPKSSACWMRDASLHRRNCSNSPRVPSYHPSWQVVLLPRCPKINYEDNILLWWHFLFRKIISAPSDFKGEFLKTGKWCQHHLCFAPMRTPRRSFVASVNRIQLSCQKW